MIRTIWHGTSEIRIVICLLAHLMILMHLAKCTWVSQEQIQLKPRSQATIEMINITSVIGWENNQTMVDRYRQLEQAQADNNY